MTTVMIELANINTRETVDAELISSSVIRVAGKVFKTWNVKVGKKTLTLTNGEGWEEVNT